MRLQRLWKPLLALGAVLAAFVVTFWWPQKNGLEADFDGSARARAARAQDPYDLTRLRVLNRALLEVKDHYVEPERIDPRRMLLSGLNAIQRNVAPVLVHYEDGQSHLQVQVNDERRQFRVDDVNAVWKLAARFREIFAFLQTNLDGEEVELRDIEYAAVNGMLHTLDPHTVLLTPDVFEEMQMNTRGEFGGLGIVISIRDGHLTIIRPMPDTPASSAGLERGDRIVQIDDESTLNMPLSEAVDRLRGAPGSRVSVWVRRKEGSRWTQPRKVDLVRAVIHIESVEHEMLSDGVGYIKVNSFQGNTHEDMQRALADLHRQRLRGLVLDLRDNPGGLLEQAVRIADTFLSGGVVVTTSSSDPSQDDVKHARRENTEPDYPMVVLVNGASASASEIVAGALKNHDRALVVGQTSFGKGSVQVLYNFEDGSALKLTIAQYLTPGQVSIQGVGIVPDIAIDPMTVDRENMDLAVDQAFLRESDLQSHLTHDSARETQRPATVLRYYLPSSTRQRLLEAGPNEEENEEEGEFLTRFSQLLLSRAHSTRRLEMIEEATNTIDQVRTQELNKAVRELRSLGIDWAEGTDRGASNVKVEVSTDRPDNVGRAGEPFSLSVKVTNEGEAPLFQLRGTTKSDYRLFDSRELVFGRLDPGQTREWTTTLGTCVTEDEERVCRLPRDTRERADGIRIEFEEAHGHAPDPAEIRTQVRALSMPQFAYSVHVADDVDGNGDGRLQRGERASMWVRVKNVGDGPTYELQANLRNLSGRGVLLQDGRFRFDDLAPGKEQLVRFTFEVLEDFEREEVKLEVGIVSVDLREAVAEKVMIPLAPGGGTPTNRSGRVNLGANTVIRAKPSADADTVGRAAQPLSLPAQAELGEFVRVELEDGQPGWVASSDIEGNGGRGSVAYHLDHMPPNLEIDYGNTLVTRDDTLNLRGTATDDQRVLDLYVFVGARKVFYKSNRSAQNPRRATFETRLPLKPGTNYITVFVRERDDVVTRETIVIRRDGADGSLMESPMYDDDPFGLDHSE